MSIELLQQMSQIRNAISDLKKQEAALLPKIVEIYGGAGESGSQTSDTDFAKVIVTKPQTFKLENKNMEAQLLGSTMNQEELIRYMKWDAKLNVGEFKKLKEIVSAEPVQNVAAGEKPTRNAELLRGIENILTIKNGKAQVKIETN